MQRVARCVGALKTHPQENATPLHPTQGASSTFLDPSPLVSRSSRSPHQLGRLLPVQPFKGEINDVGKGRDIK
jgi:hypothetical protein